jgi:AFG3 family protein
MSDLDTVTKMSYAAIVYYGMNDKVGNISFYDMMNNGQSFSKPYSEETARMIDEEARNMIDVQYVRAQKLLSDKRDLLNALAEELLLKEVLFKDDLNRVLGRRPFDPIVEEEPAVSNNVNTTEVQVEKDDTQV